MARIDEGRDPALIQVVDTAISPETQVWDWTQRAVVALLSALLIGLAGVIGIVVAEALHRAKQDAGYATQLQLIGSYWSRDKQRAKTVGAGSP